MSPDTPILFIGLSGYAYPHTRVRCYHFADGLRKLGMKTSVLSYKDDLGKQFSEADMYELRDRKKLWLNIKAFAKLFFKRKTLFYLQKIHYHSAMPYLCYRLKSQPYIFDYDDYDIPLPCIFNRPSLNQFFFKTSNYETMTEMVAKNAVACVASSHFLVDYLSKFNKRVVYIPTGVEADKFIPAMNRKPNDKLIFIWTGVVWGETILENIKFMLECFSELSKKYSNIELHMVAGGRWLPQVEELLKTQYTAVPIQICPWVEHQKMPEFLQKADIGLLPLIQDTLWTKSKSPTKLFEYLSTGLPVVASPTGEINYVLKDGETGLLAKEKNEFIQKMELLIQNPQLRKSLGENARRKVEEEYSQEILSERLYEFLCQLPIQV